MQDFKFNKVVMWGLTHKRDSFRFIYSGFKRAFEHQGLKVLWVPDLPSSQKYIDKDTLVLGVDVSYQHLPYIYGATYVTLNIPENSRLGMKLLESGKWFRLQEFTKLSHGISDQRGSICLYRPEKEMLYMPWGTPLLEHEFFPINSAQSESKKEYWIGAVWNDKLNQGNVHAIDEYKRALFLKGVDFKRIGGSRFKKSGLTEYENAIKVRESRLGAAIVGNWQRENIYYPCRLFKAVSAGISPISNLDARAIFNESLLYSSNIEELVDLSFSESLSKKIERARHAQELLKNYTYSASINRILRIVNGAW